MSVGERAVLPEPTAHDPPDPREPFRLRWNGKMERLSDERHPPDREQYRVVGHSFVAEQLLHDLVARPVEVLRRGSQNRLQPQQPLVQRLPASFDEPVRVEEERRGERKLDLHLLRTDDGDHSQRRRQATFHDPDGPSRERKSGGG